jgi:ferredoxin
MVYLTDERDSRPRSLRSHALCVAEAPEVSDLSDDEVVDIRLPEPPPEMESAVTDAVIACPKQALRIIAD